VHAFGIVYAGSVFKSSRCENKRCISFPALSLEELLKHKTHIKRLYKRRAHPSRGVSVFVSDDASFSFLSFISSHGCLQSGEKRKFLAASSKEQRAV
jgi:hypothetical protein